MMHQCRCLPCNINVKHAWRVEWFALWGGMRHLASKSSCPLSTTYLVSSLVIRERAWIVGVNCGRG